MLLHMTLPAAIQVERVGRVFFDAQICVGIEAGDFLAAVAPQAFQSMLWCFLAMHLEYVLLQCLEIVQLCGTVLPFTFVCLEARNAICDVG